MPMDKVCPTLEKTEMTAPPNFVKFFKDIEATDLLV